MKYNITRNGELVKSFIEIDDETFEDLGLEEDSEYDYTVEIAGQPESKASVSTKTLVSEPPPTILISNKVLAWADLPAYEQEDNGSLTLVSDNGDGTYTYGADFDWDNFGQQKLEWLVDVLQFKDNKLKNGIYAFYEILNTQLTALPDLDTSNLTDMTGMFCKTQFNQSLDHFDTSNVTNMHRMFANAYSFNQPLDNFDTSNVTDMGGMFRYATAFSQPLDFDTSNVTDMDTMFNYATAFNQDISNWCVEGIDSKPGDFDTNSAFVGQDDKQPKWGTPCTTIIVSNKELTWNDLPTGDRFNNSLKLISDNGDGTYTYGADFAWSNSSRRDLSWLVDVLQFKDNQLRYGYYAFLNMSAAELTALPDLDTSNLTDMQYMFCGAKNFNQPLDNFDTSRVKEMQGMFSGARAFNQPLDNFDTSNVKYMHYMFLGAEAFNQPLNFNTPKVQDMTEMFNGATSFNKPLNFKTGRCVGMESMFEDASAFNQPLNFDTSHGIEMDYMFKNATAFDQDISHWCVEVWKNPNPWVPEGFDTGSGFEGQTAKQPQWGEPCSPATVSATTVVVSSKELVWGDLPAYEQPDDGSLTLVSDNGDGTLTYEADFDWDNSGKLELTWLVDVLQFKNNQLKSGEFAFYVMPAAQLTALPNLDTSNLTNMNYMFGVARNFNQPLDNFDTSNVTSMNSMFGSTDSFNQPLDFDTSSVENMTYMFLGAISFNQPLDWDTSKVTDMTGMFMGTTGFNRPINFSDTSNVTGMTQMFAYAEPFNEPLNFDTSSVTDMAAMFAGTKRFNQNISNWCVSQIARKPNGFDYDSVFANYPAKQPKWGQAC